MGTAVDHDAAGSIVGMSFHFAKTGRAILDLVKLIWVDRFWFVIDAGIVVSKRSRQVTKGLVVDHIAATVIAKANLYRATQHPDLKTDFAAWAIEPSCFARWCNRFVCLVDFRSKTKGITGVTLEMRLSVNWEHLS